MRRADDVPRRDHRRAARVRPAPRRGDRGVGRADRDARRHATASSRVPSGGPAGCSGARVPRSARHDAWHRYSGTGGQTAPDHPSPCKRRFRRSGEPAKMKQVSPSPCRSLAERWAQMADPTQPGPAPPADEGSGETTRTFAGRDAVAGRRNGGSATPPGRTPTEAAQHEPPTKAPRPWPPTEGAQHEPPTKAPRPWPPTEAARPPTEAARGGPPTEAAQHGPSAEIVSYGPGVPAPMSGSQARQRAEHIWRGGRPPAQARRRPSLPRLLSSALTVILLAASGVVLYLRFHHSQPLHVIGLTITRRTPVACGVHLTGRIATNGAAGTVVYQWRVRPRRRQPRVRTRAFSAGQHSLPVPLAVSAKGHGTASKLVTLQVLAPDPRKVSVRVTVSC
jgi:hypothetical protein